MRVRTAREGGEEGGSEGAGRWLGGAAAGAGAGASAPTAVLSRASPQLRVCLCHRRPLSSPSPTLAQRRRGGRGGGGLHRADQPHTETEQPPRTPSHTSHTATAATTSTDTTTTTSPHYQPAMISIRQPSKWQALRRWKRQRQRRGRRAMGGSWMEAAAAQQKRRSRRRQPHRSMARAAELTGERANGVR